MTADPSISGRAGSFVTVFLGLGSNDRPEIHLSRAIRLLRRRLQVTAVSSAWKSPAIGPPAPPYLNAALRVRTDRPLPALRSGVCRPIEAALGRDRSEPHPTRVPVDIDILIYAGQVIEPDIWELAYRAVPLAEIAPGLRRPSTGEPVSAIARRLVAGTDLVCMPGALRL